MSYVLKSGLSKTVIYNTIVDHNTSGVPLPPVCECRFSEDRDGYRLFFGGSVISRCVFLTFYRGVGLVFFYARGEELGSPAGVPFGYLSERGLLEEGDVMVTVLKSRLSKTAVYDAVLDHSPGGVPLPPVCRCDFRRYRGFYQLFFRDSENRDWCASLGMRRGSCRVRFSRVFYDGDGCFYSHAYFLRPVEVSPVYLRKRGMVRSVPRDSLPDRPF